MPEPARGLPSLGSSTGGNETIGALEEVLRDAQHRKHDHGGSLRLGFRTVYSMVLSSGDSGRETPGEYLNNESEILRT